MIYNDEQVDFILLGVTEADGGVRIVGLTGLTQGYMQSSRASADLGRLGPHQQHVQATVTASYSGTCPVYSRADAYAEAFAALGFDLAPESEEAE